MGKRLLGQSFPQANIPSAAPVGAVGIDMTQFLEATRPRMWLVTITVTVAPSDVFAWGATPRGAAGDITDDIWGKYQDEYGTFPLGKIATALPVGVYHFMTDGLGLYSRVYFQKSAGTVDVILTEVLEAGRGN